MRLAMAIAATALALMTGCAPPPPPVQNQAAGKPTTCQAGASARGIAAGFFAIVQDRPECF